MYASADPPPVRMTRSPQLEAFGPRVDCVCVCCCKAHFHCHGGDSYCGSWDFWFGFGKAIGCLDAPAGLDGSSDPDMGLFVPFPSLSAAVDPGYGGACSRSVEQGCQIKASSDWVASSGRGFGRTVSMAEIL